MVGGWDDRETWNWKSLKQVLEDNNGVVAFAEA